LQRRLGGVTFPAQLKKADQSGAARGAAVRAATGIELAG
jgi:hypothetical protein